MEKLKKYSWIAGLVIAVVLTASVAYAAVSGVVIQNVENFNYSSNESGVDVSGVELGIAQKASKFTDVEVTNELQTATLTVTGDAAISGSINSLEAITTVATVNIVTTPSTTLTAAMSGETFVFTTTTEFILPTTSTASGLNYKFVVGAGITASTTIRTSELGDNIEGTLIVAGAVVDCDAENYITFGAGGENIGDFVELYSDGTYWYIGSSNALSSPYLTCSTY